jgi:SAM-dependent methyltransferase
LALEKDKLQRIAIELASKPGHEKVRTLVYQLLIDGLLADESSIDFERQVPEVRGRIDALLGRTVFEIKRDLGRERSDAEAQLLRYLPQRELETKQRFTGIATDGSEFRVYIVREGKLAEIGHYRTNLNDPRDLLRWLESVVVLTTEILPDVEGVRRELGRESIAYHRALEDIDAMWAAVTTNPEANLKRDLWNRLLRVAYGGDIEAPQLFLQHTYLTIVAKAIATVALFDELPKSGAALLAGESFNNLGISGAVESDFFDWVLLAQGGDELVMNIARHANRFRLRDINADILKGLYESLIDPDQRHDLGEYYTPDWLAARICQTAITRPLEQRVIDPACGSGTFLFHAIRRALGVAAERNLPIKAAVAGVIEKIAGIDVHPVAIIFARTTYLLALLPALQEDRPSTLTVPVYLGDALQWNAREFMSMRDLEIVVPAQGEAAKRGGQDADDEGDDERVILRFPSSLASEPGRFDAVLDEMLKLAEAGASVAKLDGVLKTHGVLSGSDADMIRASYTALCTLQRQRRNHIWGYVARNLSRPIWLASEAQKADVVIGNPPWLAYSRMSPATQGRFREEMKSIGLWGGMQTVSAFDLSAYFFVRAIWLYMRSDGIIAFVLPFAAMFKKPYKNFRSGKFRVSNQDIAYQFFEGWAFPSSVQPLFPVPACVLFARLSIEQVGLPKAVHFFDGHLPRRDASPEEASKALAEIDGTWPEDESAAPGSPYRTRFRQGAILIPRRLVLVERTQTGRLGANPEAPIVRGRTGSQDKKPWKDIDPPQGPVEAQFLRPVYLGECIAPYRLLDPVLAVIPWDDEAKALLNSAQAQTRGHTRLSGWLQRIEALWSENGTDKRTFAEQLDFFEQLSSQFPIASLRVIYGKAGTNPAAAMLRDRKAVIDHMLYWAAVETIEEGRYLTAILNSETTRKKVEHWQAQGQWGARHFDKVMFNLPIQKFDKKKELHQHLTQVAEHAEKVAAAMKFEKGTHFTRVRASVREALYADGVGERIDVLVGQLLS